MQINLVDAEGTTKLLPESFGIEDLAPPQRALPLTSIVGRDGAIVGTRSFVGPRDINVRGRIQDESLLEQQSWQAARASALDDYYELIGFLNNAATLGPLKVYRENGIIIDPSHEDYDATLAPLGRYLLGYYVGGGESVPYWGGFGNAIIDVSLRFICPSPHWQGHFNTSSKAGSVGGGQSISLPFSVAGTVPAKPQLVLYSTAGLTVQTGKAITLTIGSLSVSWNGVIPAAGYIVFDCASGQVFSGSTLPFGGLFKWDGTVATNKGPGLISSDIWASKIWALPTGSYTLAVTGDMTSAAGLTTYVLFPNEYYG